MVRRGDPARFLAAMSGGPEARARLLPLYALNLEVARAPWVSAEPMIVAMRLQWWRDAVAEIAAGRPARRHEVTEALTGVPLVAGVLDGLVAAREAEVAPGPGESADALRAHLAATAGALMWAAALLLGAGPDAEARVRGLGAAQGLANWLEAVPALAARGRPALPAGHEALIRDGLAAVAAARAARLPRALGPALRAASETGGVLRRALAEPARIAAGTLPRSEFARRARLLAKAATGGY